MITYEQWLNESNDPTAQRLIDAAFQDYPNMTAARMLYDYLVESGDDTNAALLNDAFNNKQVNRNIRIRPNYIAWVYQDGGGYLYARRATRIIVHHMDFRSEQRRLTPHTWLSCGRLSFEGTRPHVYSSALPGIDPITKFRNLLSLIAHTT